VRIVTFNVQHARRPDGGVDTAALAATVAAWHPDVVALQELDAGVARSGRVDQAAEVARAAGLAVAFGPACRVGARGRYGNALLVRGEVAELANLALPRVGRHERRAVLVAAAIVKGCRLSVAATHLSVDPAEAPAQLAAALDALAARPPPRLLLGDLNLRPAAVSAALAGRGMVLADPSQPTFPAADPRARIDHVAVQGLAVERVEVLAAAPVSDHRALLVEASAPG